MAGGIAGGGVSQYKSPVERLRKAVRDRDARDAGPYAGAAILAGWAVAGVACLVNGDYVGAAIAAAAGWLTLVLLVVALLNLFSFLAAAPGERLWPGQRLPAGLRPVLAPATFLIGIVVGRLIWH